MRVEVFRQGQLLQEFKLQESELLVGRDDSCKIRLDDRAISRKHGLIRSSEKGGLEFEKITEIGWVKLNGQNISTSKLKAGDRLEMGPFQLLISSDEKTVEPLVATAKMPVTDTVPEATIEASTDEQFVVDAPSSAEEPPVTGSSDQDFSVSGDVPGFEVNLGEPVLAEDPIADVDRDFTDEPDGATRILDLNKSVKPILNFNGNHQYEIIDDEIAIGRSQNCHVVLEDRRSSRKHSLIKKVDGKFVIQDLGSANGTVVNGMKVSEQDLHSGDEILIGDTKFTFEMVQADYEVKKQQFISVPQPEMEMVPPELMPTSHAQEHAHVHPDPIPVQQPNYAPQFEESKQNNDLIQKLRGRWQSMNTRQQIMWGGVILMVIYTLFESEPEEKKIKLLNDPQKKTAKKKEEKDAGPAAVTLQSLTQAQRDDLEARYQLGFDLYKNREYDRCLLEMEKIFTIIPDYKNAREISAFAREGKRKLEAIEEERKRKEQERQTQLKLQGLVEQAGHFMDQKKYREAEALFPDIELIQPENVAVAEWRKQIIEENERIAKEESEKKRIKDLHDQAMKDFEQAKLLVGEKKYYEALDRFDQILARNLEDQKLVGTIRDEISRVEGLIEAEKEPFLSNGKQLEKEGRLSEAYRAYVKTLEVDPMDDEAPVGMKRIKGVLTDRAKKIYTEGVFAESYGDFDTAEKKFREVLEVVAKDNEYFSKAESKLRKLTVFKKSAVGEGLPQ